MEDVLLLFEVFCFYFATRKSIKRNSILETYSHSICVIGDISRRGGSRRNVIRSRRELQGAGKGEHVLCVYVFLADDASDLVVTVQLLELGS